MAEKDPSSTTVINAINKYWLIWSLLATGGVVWGQTTYKVHSLEEAVKQNATTQAEVNELKSKVERVDERTRAMQESQARQERLIEMLLAEQRRSNAAIEANVNRGPKVGSTSR